MICSVNIFFLLSNQLKILCYLNNINYLSLMIKSISFIVLTQVFHFNELKILRQLA